MAAQQEIPQQTVDEFVAAAHGDIETVKRLLHEHPRLVNAPASWGEMGIQAATQTGQKEIAEFLLAAGAPLDICTAAMLGMQDRVQEFLAGEPGLVHAVGAHSLPVLYFPVAAGQRPTAEILLANGADVNAGEGRQTPLHGAVVFEQAEMAAWLLDRGANTGLRDSKGRTALELAQALGRHRLTALLTGIS